MKFSLYIRELVEGGAATSEALMRAGNLTAEQLGDTLARFLREHTPADGLETEPRDAGDKASYALDITVSADPRSLDDSSRPNPLARVIFVHQGRDPLEGKPVGFVEIRDKRADGLLGYGYQSLAYARRLADQMGLALEEVERT